MNTDAYQRYFDQYTRYCGMHVLGTKYLDSASTIITNKDYQLLHYVGARPRQSVNFLVIPSIFNSPEILFLARSSSFVDNLRLHGNIYLLDWQTAEKAECSLKDYVQRTVEVIDHLKQNNISDIHLIGHCIGGNLAVAACIIKPNVIKSLTLLTTPWDFSHFTVALQLYRYLELDTYLKNLPFVPKIHMQILFFLLSPDYFTEKLNMFFLLTSSQEKDLAFRIEHWLMSGTSISKNTYSQIIHDIIENNMFNDLQWRVNNAIINPDIITQPVYQVMASKDQLVPKSSILPLHNLLKNSKLFTVEGGHISYLINNKLSNLFEEYTK